MLRRFQTQSELGADGIAAGGAWGKLPACMRGRRSLPTPFVTCANPFVKMRAKMRTGVFFHARMCSATHTQKAPQTIVNTRKNRYHLDTGFSSVWQREKDSNPHIRSQSPLCYHYTIPLCWRTKTIIRILRKLSTPFCISFGYFYIASDLLFLPDCGIMYLA